MAARLGVVVLCALIAACGDGDGGGGAGEPAVATTTAASAPAAGPPSTLPKSGCCDGVEVPAGLYELPPYWGDPLVVEIGDGWRVNFENGAVLLAFVQGSNAVQDPSRWFYLMRAPAGLTPKDVIDAMAAMTSITLDGSLVEVEVAGFAGYQFEAVANDDPDQPAVPANGIEAGSIRFEALNDTGYFTTGFIAASATRQSMLRFVALDVGDRTLLALVDAPPAEFAAFAAEAEAILASLRPA